MAGETSRSKPLDTLAGLISPGADGTELSSILTSATSGVSTPETTALSDLIFPGASATTFATTMTEITAGTPNNAGRRLSDLISPGASSTALAAILQGGGGGAPSRLLRPFGGRFTYASNLTADPAKNMDHSRPPIYTNNSGVVIDELRVMFTNFVVTASSDNLPTNQSIIYRAGFQAASLSNATKVAGTSVTIGPAGFGYSIISGLNIQPGDQFYINCRAEGTLNKQFPLAFSNNSPTRLAYFGTDTGDYTVANSATQPQAGGNGVIPFALIGYQVGLPQTVVGLYGDSIQIGAVGIGFSEDACRDAGTAPINFAVSGAQINGQTLTNRDLVAVELGVSLAYINYGINDVVIGGRTAAQVITSLNARWTAMKAKGWKVIQHTISPKSTQIVGGSDWSAANQTTTSYKTDIDAINAHIRSGGAGLLDGYFDYSDVMSTSRDSGIFKDNYTIDGTHPSATGAAAARTAMASDIATRL